MAEISNEGKKKDTNVDIEEIKEDENHDIQDKAVEEDSSDSDGGKSEGEAQEGTEEPEVVIEEDKDEKPELTEEQISKRDDKTVYIIVASIIVIIILFFAISYYYNTHRTPKDDAAKRVSYNNFDFYYYDRFWNFEWQRGQTVYDAALRYNPYEAETVPVYVKRPFNNFSTQTVYLTFDPLGNNTPYMALGVGELGLSMKKVFGFTPEAACTQNKTESCETRPIINCSNTNQSVILMQEVNDTMVLVDDNCLIIQGSQMEMLRAIDRILYEWYGIIKPKALVKDKSLL
jgi:hypothetical protein